MMPSQISKATYILWAAAGIAVFVLITIFGFKVFYGFVVPQAQAVSQLGTLLVLGFAFLAGIAAVFVGGAILFSEKSSPSTEDLAVSSVNLRALELSVPGMFCAGCSASVEGYVSSMAGVKRVRARLTPTKSATVVYDPDVITKEEIVKNPIFDIYGVEIISDEEFSGSVLVEESQDGVAVPKEIQDKSQETALLLQQKASEGKDVTAAQGLFNQVNSDIEQGNFANASNLLDVIINILEAL